MKRCLQFLFLLVFLCVSHAEESNYEVLPQCKQVDRAKVWTWKFNSAPRGLLVVTGAYGQNPSGSALIEIDNWKKSAESRGFALAMIDFDWHNINAPKNAFDGGTEILKQVVAKVSDRDIPVFLCTKNDSGNRFLFDCLDKNTPAIAGWLCYANKTWAPVPRQTQGKNIPGVIVTAADSILYNDARSFYSKGRKAGKDWTWLLYKPQDTPLIKDFAAAYFDAIIAGGSPQLRSLTTGKEISPDLFQDASDDWTWFPNAAIGEHWGKLQTERNLLPKVIEQEIDLSKSNLPNITLYLRLPPGQKDASQVKGVVAYCTWVRDRATLIQQLSFDTNQSAEKMGWPAVQLLRFATDHDLAVVTWSTPGKWQAGTNSDELDRDTMRMDDKAFDIYARAWAQGIEFFCSNYQLPRDNYLLYGMSRGAQWAHRLALRQPKYFLAINSHVSGSYEKPNPEAGNCLWLVTGGEVDVGYDNAVKFYRECLGMNYPVLFKAGQDLGHETRPDIEALRDAFFEYALSIKDEVSKRNQEGKNLTPWFREAAKFIGNFETFKVVSPGEIAKVPEENRVYLPTEKLAEAWKLPPAEINQ